MINILGQIATIITSLIVIVGFFISITKWGKKIIANWFGNIFKMMLEKELNPIKSATKCVLRKNIDDMCGICIDRDYITRKECEDISEANDAYCGLNGNSYTAAMVKTALSLPMRG